MALNALSSTIIKPGQRIVIHKQKPLVDIFPTPDSKPIITTTPTAEEDALIIPIPPQIVNKNQITIIPLEDEAPMIEVFPQYDGKTIAWFLATYWDKTTYFRGNKVYQRDDLFDIHLVDDKGRTNLQRMKEGTAPIGIDGNSINLHHMTQRQEGSIAEMTHSFHKGHHKIIHINPSTIPSGIDRAVFNKWRYHYWKERALDIESRLK